MHTYIAKLLCLLAFKIVVYKCTIMHTIFTSIKYVQQIVCIENVIKFVYYYSL